MASKATNTQRHDRREANRLKEKGHEQHNNTNLPRLRHRRSKESHRTRQIHQEDPARTHELHNPRAEESADRERALRAGEILRRCGIRRTGPGILDIVDEVAGDSD